MELYTDDGYLNVPALKATGYPFIWVCGGRGTGKTYGAIKDMVETHSAQADSMIVRRTEKERVLLESPLLSPVLDYGVDAGKLFAFAPIVGSVGGIFGGAEEDGKIVPNGDCYGYTAALSTFANMRGFNGMSVNTIVFDEFIKQPQVRPIKDEAGAFFNLYETVNRNRELNGRKPVQALMLANSFEMANPYFVALGLVDRAEKMRATGQEVYMDAERGHLLVILSRSGVSAKKADTALYRATAGSGYAEMALANKFSDRGNYTTAKPRTLKGCRPVCFVGELAIYERKGAGRYYVTSHHTGNADSYGDSDTELARFRRVYGGGLWRAYLVRAVDFDSIAAEIKFREYVTG